MRRYQRLEPYYVFLQQHKPGLGGPDPPQSEHHASAPIPLTWPSKRATLAKSFCGYLDMRGGFWTPLGLSTPLLGKMLW